MKTRIAIVAVIILLMPVLAFAIVRKCNAEKPVDVVQTEQTCDDTQSVVANEEEIAAEEPKPDVIVIVERSRRPVLHFCGRALHRLIIHPFHRCGK